MDSDVVGKCAFQLMLVSHCGEYPCECKKIYSANSPDSGDYMANGLTNAIRHQSQ